MIRAVFGTGSSVARSPCDLHRRALRPGCMRRYPEWRPRHRAHAPTPRLPLGALSPLRLASGRCPHQRSHRETGPAMLTSELRGRVLAGSLDPGPQPADYLAVQFGYKLKRIIIMLIKLLVQPF